MSEGMQVMTVVIAGFVALATMVTVPMTANILAWERVATECIGGGGTWMIASVPGYSNADWACTRTPTSH